MSCAGGNCRVGLQDGADALEGAERRVGDSVSHAVIILHPIAFAPHKVAFTIFLEQEGAFYIVLRCHFFIQRAVGEGYNRFEVVGEFYQIAAAPAAIIHIVAAIGMTEYKLVDGLRAVDNVIDQRMPEQILERAFGFVADGYADAADFSFVYIVRAEEEIVFAIFFDNRRCP